MADPNVHLMLTRIEVLEKRVAAQHNAIHMNAEEIEKLLRCVDLLERRVAKLERAATIAHVQIGQVMRRTETMELSCHCPAEPGEDCPLTKVECARRVRRSAFPSRTHAPEAGRDPG